MDYRKARFYGIWCQVIAFGAVVLAIVYLNTPWLYIFGTLGVLCGLGSVAVMALFWRCPRCRKRLPGDSVFSLRRCPHCAAKLEPALPEEEAGNKESTEN